MGNVPLHIDTVTKAYPVLQYCRTREACGNLHVERHAMDAEQAYSNVKARPFNSWTLKGS